MIRKITLKILLAIVYLTIHFNAYSQDIQLISPNGGEKLIPGERYSISWVSNSDRYINIYYRTDVNNKWEIVRRNVYSKLGSYSWKVPELNSPNGLIKIEDSSDKTVFDESDSYFIMNEFPMNSSFIKSGTSSTVIRIMPLGNSITFDTRSNDPRPVEDRIGYRYPLYNLLNDGAFNFSFIGSEHSGSNFFAPFTEFDKNAGFPGIKDDELYTLLSTGRRYQPLYGIDETITDGRYLDTYSTDIILLHIGTNGNEQAGGTSAADVENILDEIDEYENDTGNEIIVLLARIIDRVPPQTYVTDFNDNVESMVLDRINNPMNDAYPDQIVLVDMQSDAGIIYAIDSMGTVGNGKFGDMNDQLHPNDKGYLKMAQVWYDTLESILTDPPVIQKQPIVKSVIEGDTVQFSISAVGTFPNFFQWKRNGVEISGETDSVIIIENVGVDYDKSYFSCVVSSIGGAVESDSALLNVTGMDSRVTSNLIVLYDYDEGSGNIINDKAEHADQIDLTINSPSKVNWVPSGLSVNSSASINSSDPLDKLFNSLKSSNELTVETWIKPTSKSQNGPARIITFSKNVSERNFGLFQTNSRYDFRLRNTSTDPNGVPSLITPSETVKENVTHLIYTFSSQDTAELYINGESINKISIPGDFTNWDSTYSFGIANEFVDAKPWLGTFYLTAIYDRALSSAEVKHNYSQNINGLNIVQKPTNLQTLKGEGTTVELNWDDNSDNELGFAIMRSMLAEGTFEVIDSVSTDNIVYIDTMLNEGIKYAYKIFAYNDFSNSDSSNVSEITTDIPAPSDLAGNVENEGDVMLTWIDNSGDELGFVIEGKAAHQDSSYSVIDSVSENTNSYLDTTLKYFSPYNYRVYAYGQDTTSNFTNEIIIDVVSVDGESNLSDKNYALDQNYPNPFNPITKIKYFVPERANISLYVFDILGKPIKRLVDRTQNRGSYEISFNASNLSSGVYFYKLKAISTKSGKEFADVKKLLLLK